jgi:nitrite reductase/ring-hydroxylating ferredoxin subunit
VANNNNKSSSARASGPSVADVLNSDSVAPPAPLLEQAEQAMGSEDIPCSRYTSREYFDREMQLLWPRTWQWACRVEHIPEAGDTYVYEVGHWSVIVVRGDDQIIRAFMNSCTHRGTKILGGSGTGYSASFTCPFHGWSWHLNGEVKNIPARWDFPHADERSHSLREVSCDTWGGFVFINMDPAARPLLEFMDVMPEHFAHFPLEQRQVSLHVEKILPANWKATQEAFLEAYHNFETHDAPNGANAQYDVFGKYVSRFIHNIGSYSVDSLDDYPGTKWRQPALTQAEQLAALGIEGIPIAEGETARSVAAAALREELGEKLGVDFSETSDSLIMDSIEYHMFPNMFFFPGINIPMVYRFRPNGSDIDSCIFDLMILEPIPAGTEPAEPPEPVQLTVEQSYTEVEALKWLAPVYDQDTGNLQMQQEGLKTNAKPGITLGNYQEARIRRIHLTLEEFLQ